MNGLAPGASDVTTIRCENRDGFWVPSSRYRLMRTAELDLSLNKEIGATIEAKADAWQSASLAWAKTASAASKRADVYKQASDASFRALLEANERAAGERSWIDHPGVWLGAGVLGTILSVWALGVVLRGDR